MKKPQNPEFTYHMIVEVSPQRGFAVENNTGAAIVSEVLAFVKD